MKRLFIMGAAVLVIVLTAIATLDTFKVSTSSQLHQQQETQTPTLTPIAELPLWCEGSVVIRVDGISMDIDCQAIEATETPVPTMTPTPTAVPTATPTVVPTFTATHRHEPIPGFTATPVPTQTPTAPTPTMSVTVTPDGTLAPTQEPTPTAPPPVSTTASVTPPERIIVEAESGTLTGVQIQFRNFYSGGRAVIGTGTAVYTLSLPEGLYNVIIVYHDENDGLGTIAVTLDGLELDAWVLDMQFTHPDAHSSTPENRVERLLAASPVEIMPGQVLAIRSQAQAGELVRVDYLAFVPVSVPPETLPVTLTYPTQITAGEVFSVPVTLQLDTAGSYSIDAVINYDSVLQFVGADDLTITHSPDIPQFVASWEGEAGTEPVQIGVLLFRPTLFLTSVNDMIHVEQVLIVPSVPQPPGAGDGDP